MRRGDLLFKGTIPPIYHISQNPRDSPMRQWASGDRQDSCPRKRVQPLEGTVGTDSAGQKSWRGLYVVRGAEGTQAPLSKFWVLVTQDSKKKSFSQPRGFSPNSSHNYKNNLYASAFPPQQRWLNKHKYVLRYTISCLGGKKSPEGKALQNSKCGVSDILWGGGRSTQFGLLSACPLPEICRF